MTTVPDERLSDGGKAPKKSPEDSPHKEWDMCVQKAVKTVGVGVVVGAVLGMLVGADLPLIWGTGISVAWSIKRCRALLRDGIITPEMEAERKRQEKMEREKKKLEEKEAKEAKNRKKLEGAKKETESDCCKRLEDQKDICAEENEKNKAEGADKQKGDDKKKGKGDDKKAGKGDDKKAGKGDDKKAGKGDDKKAGKGDDKKAGKGDDKKAGKGDDKKAGKGDDMKAGKGDDKKTGKGGDKDKDKKGTAKAGTMQGDADDDSDLEDCDDEEDLDEEEECDDSSPKPAKTAEDDVCEIDDKSAKAPQERAEGEDEEFDDELCDDEEEKMNSQPVDICEEDSETQSNNRQNEYQEYDLCDDEQTLDDCTEQETEIERVSDLDDNLPCVEDLQQSSYVHKSSSYPAVYSSYLQQPVSRSFLPDAIEIFEEHEDLGGTNYQKNEFPVKTFVSEQFNRGSRKTAPSNDRPLRRDGINIEDRTDEEACEEEEEEEAIAETNEGGSVYDDEDESVEDLDVTFSEEDFDAIQEVRMDQNLGNSGENQSKSDGFPFPMSLPSLENFHKKPNASFKWPPLPSSIIVKPKRQSACTCDVHQHSSDTSEDS